MLYFSMFKDFFRPTKKTVKRNGIVGSLLFAFSIIFIQAIEPENRAWDGANFAGFVGSYLVLMRSLFPIFFTYTMKEYPAKYSDRYLKSPEPGFVIMRELMLIRS